MGLCRIFGVQYIPTSKRHYHLLIRISKFSSRFPPFVKLILISHVYYFVTSVGLLSEIGS
jgi:hypothetical protein